MALNSIVVGGAHILVYLNGILCGRCIGMTYSSQTTTKEARGCDFPMPFEIMPSMTSTSGTINILKTTGDGGALGLGLTVQQPDIGKAKYFSLLVLDRRSKTAIFKADYCMASAESWDIQPKGVITGSITFSAISWSSENSTINGLTKNF